MKSGEKIFCIGFNKTGTTSLMNFFLNLSIKTCDGIADSSFKDVQEFYYSEDKFKYLEKLLSSFVAFEDVPWPIFYKELFNKFPNSYYILTTRNADAWIRSCKNHFCLSSENYPIHEFIYGIGKGSPINNEKEWISTYEKHNEDVIQFFSINKNAKFLHIKIDEEDNKEISKKILEFIGQPNKKTILKTSNKASKKYSKIFKNLYTAMRSIKYSIFGKKSIKIFGFSITKDFTELMKK